MHIRRLRIQDIRSITDLDVEIPEPRAGWHVILGDNGSGKSSVIRAMALALMGPLDALATRQNWQDWVRKTAIAPHEVLMLSLGGGPGLPRARVELEVAPDAEFDKWKGTGRRAKQPITVTVTFPPTATITLLAAGTRANSAAPEIAGRHADRTIWGGGTGWFSASFGPFRRFSGGDKEYDRLFYSNPGLACHLSAFGEDVALGEALRWLQDLQFKRYEKDAAAIRLLDHLVDFLRRSQLLPHGAHIKEITSGAVVFNDGAGVPLPVEQLSDGFRSVLSMTFELLRGMVVAYGDSMFLDALDAEAGAVNLPGVVAIDEIDAHMHPAWQKRIGDWLVERFPMVQFFVTTHSPIICRSAAKGSIWRLPTPGTGEEAHRIEGQDRDRLVNGSILDAFDTEYFGENVTRSDASHSMMKELAKLNMKRRRGPLSADEDQRRRKLQSALPSVSAISE